MTKIKVWRLFSPRFFFFHSVLKKTTKNQKKTWGESVSQVHKVHSKKLCIITCLITWCYKHNCTETSVAASQLLLLFWHNQNIYHAWSQLFLNQIGQYGWSPQFKPTSHHGARQHARKQGNQTCLAKQCKADRLSHRTALSACHYKEFHHNFTNMAFWKPSTILE